MNIGSQAMPAGKDCSDWRADRCTVKVRSITRVSAHKTALIPVLQNNRRDPNKRHYTTRTA